jgi:CHASE2 domain-containing sensor protein
MVDLPKLIREMLVDGRLIIIGTTKEGNPVYRPNPQSLLDINW